ncbi:uncharacterized protein METZ01_LOCUS496387, partial [marine metagenome]
IWILFYGTKKVIIIQEEGVRTVNWIYIEKKPIDVGW